jgi:predicted negative regulator of RcsB-dependent stress response
VNIGTRVAKLYDSDKYKTGYGLSSLYFRIGSIHLSARYYKNSEFWFRKAEDELSWFQTYVGDKTVRNLVRLGIAQSLCGQRKPKASNKIIEEIKEDGGIPSTTKSNLACVL